MWTMELSRRSGRERWSNTVSTTHRLYLE
jgi:hypothetical protein